jgi:hypothetical protein
MDVRETTLGDVGDEKVAPTNPSANIFVNSPDILVLLNVDFVKLSLDRRDDILFHFHGNMLWKHRQEQTFLQHKSKDQHTREEGTRILTYTHARGEKRHAF